MDNILRKIERGTIVVLILAVAFLCHKFSTEHADKVAAQLAAKGLPPDVLAQYTYKNNLLTELIKNAQGKTEVVTKYVPDESQITVVTKERDEAVKKYQDLLDQLKTAKTPAQQQKIEAEIKTVDDTLNKPPEITAPTWGLTSRFGYGLAVSPGHSVSYGTGDGKTVKLPISPELDWKYAYWNRYSALIQANAFYIGPEFTRHIDDLTPRWMHVNNLEFGASGGLNWTGGRSLGINLRSNW